MASKTDLPLASTVDRLFWRHITRETVVLDIVHFADIDRQQYLRELSSRVRSGNYHPTTCWTIGFPKMGGVIRPVMAMSLADACVYYFCVKKIQDRLVKEIGVVEHVYGGFRITEPLRLRPSHLDNLVFDPSYEGFSSYNFRKAWSEYQNLAKRLSEAKFDYYMHLDIAHFYDAIRLDLLERQVRNVVSEDGAVVDLLFYFLRNLKPSYQVTYSDNSVGLPQEEAAEMSRLLANFYLSQFDRAIVPPLSALFTSDRGALYQYTRYADDIWIAFHGERFLANKAAQIVGQVLSDIGLHLNDAKTRVLTKFEYDKHWCFNEFDRVIHAKEDPRLLLTTLRTIYSRRKQMGRWYTPFNYGLKTLASIGRKNLTLTARDTKWLVGILLNEAHIMSRRNRSISSFYTEVVKGHRNLIEKTLRYLLAREILYPLVSYVVWEVVLPIIDEDTAINAMEQVYNRSTWRDLWWYERCISLKYFSKHATTITKKYRRLLEGLLESIKSSAEVMNELERRASIRFLSSLPDRKGFEILRTDFSQPRDLRLIAYLSKA